MIFVLFLKHKTNIALLEELRMKQIINMLVVEMPLDLSNKIVKIIIIKLFIAVAPVFLILNFP